MSIYTVVTHCDFNLKKMISFYSNFKIFFPLTLSLIFSLNVWSLSFMNRNELLWQIFFKNKITNISWNSSFLNGKELLEMTPFIFIRIVFLLWPECSFVVLTFLMKAHIGKISLLPSRRNSLYFSVCKYEQKSDCTAVQWRTGYTILSMA